MLRYTFYSYEIQYIYIYCLKNIHFLYTLFHGFPRYDHIENKFIVAIFLLKWNKIDEI